MGILYKIWFPLLFVTLFCLISAKSSGQTNKENKTTRSSYNKISGFKTFNNNAPVKQLRDNANTIISPKKTASQIIKLGKTNAAVYFSEDFDGIPGPTAGGAGTYLFPSGWVLVNNDGRAPAASVAYVNAAWERREDFNFNVLDSAAFSTSWYAPVGQADDWMISPAITIGNNTRLSWNAVTYDPSYPDGYEVRISTTSQTMAACLANPALFSISAENTVWTSRTVDLAAAGYANETVYIAWRNNSNDKFLLLIDDIVVEEFVQYDAQITGTLLPSRYTIQPQWQLYPVQMGASVKNGGSNTITNVQVKADVYQNGSHIYTDLSNPAASIAPGSAEEITLAPYIPSDTGFIVINYSVIINEIDQDTTSNTAVSSKVYISENEIARDDGLVTGSLGIGAGNGGELGLSYTLNSPGYLSAVKFSLTRNYLTEPVSASVRSFKNGYPDSLIAVTDTFYSSNENACWVTLGFNNGPLYLPADTFVVTLNESDSTLALGQTTAIFTTGAGWVNWPTNPFGRWANIEEFGAAFSKPFMLRPVIRPNKPVDAQLADALLLSGYTIMPRSQMFPLNLGASVKNNGSGDITDVQVKADIYLNGSLTYTGTSLPASFINADSIKEFSLISYTPPDTGLVEIIYSIIMNELDEDTSNNCRTMQVYISENELARDDGQYVISMSIGAGEGELGSNFTLNKPAFLSAVKFYLSKNHPEVPVFAYLRDFENGKPGEVIAVSDTFFAPGNEGQWISLNIKGGSVYLAADTFAVTINEVDSALYLGQSANIYHPGTNWVIYPGIPGGNWLGVEAFGYDNRKQFMIRPILEEYINTPFIVVDGIKDSFYTTLTGPDDGYLQIRSYAFNDMGMPDNDNDLSARVWTAWDSTWFYLYEEVRDDTISGNSETYWHQDHLDLNFDPKPGLHLDVWKASLTADVSGGFLYGDSLNLVADSDKQYIRKIIPGGYVLELAIKWKTISFSPEEFAESVTPAADSIFGFALVQYDNDGRGLSHAGISWAADLSHTLINNPRFLGTVMFLQDHKLKFIPINIAMGDTNFIPYDGSDYIITGNKKNNSIPLEFSLSQNYPNPFNPSTRIKFALPNESLVDLRVYDILGNEAAVLLKEQKAAGEYEVEFGAQSLSSGVYFYKLKAGSFVKIKKMLLIK